MDLATLLGLIGGFGIVIASILAGGSLSIFINMPSVYIVVGGTVAATLMKFSMRDFLGAFKVAAKAFIHKMDKPEDVISKAVELAGIVRKEGLLALENQDVGNAFFQKGLRLCVDGLEPEFVRKVLETELDQTLERHERGQKIFRAIGDVAPAMGMIGTLIGLVQMLTVMDDPKMIGPAMAVALLTTLYGSVIANMVALPIADKLELRASDEQLVKSLIIESIAAIQESRNPRVIEELLRTYLPPAMREAAASK